MKNFPAFFSGNDIRRKGPQRANPRAEPRGSAECLSFAGMRESCTASVVYCNCISHARCWVVRTVNRYEAAEWAAMGSHGQSMRGACRVEMRNASDRHHFIKEGHGIITCGETCTSTVYTDHLFYWELISICPSLPCHFKRINICKHRTRIQKIEVHFFPMDLRRMEVATVKPRMELDWKWKLENLLFQRGEEFWGDKLRRTTNGCRSGYIRYLIHDSKTITTKKHPVWFVLKPSSLRPSQL